MRHRAGLLYALGVAIMQELFVDNSDTDTKLDGNLIFWRYVKRESSWIR